MSKYLKEPWTVRFVKWLAQYLWGFTWVWQHVLSPIGRRVFKIYKWFANIYIAIWNKLVYDSKGRFRRARAGMTIIATAAFIYLIPHIAFFGYQSALYAATNNNEVIYLTNSQEIDADNDVHAVRGCESLPCEESNSVYFRVRGTLFHQTYFLFTTGHMMFPDRIASVVAPGVNKCNVESYGIRIKTLMRRGDWYPDMLDAKCMPMNGASEGQ